MSIRSRLSFFSFLIIILFSLVPPASLKSQQKIASTDELVKQSEVVAVGTVANLSSEWNESHTMIRTRVTLAVDQYVKGSNSGNTITLMIPGGEIDGVGELYSHMPKFIRQEQVVVFAQKNSEGTYRVAGGREGKFTVQKDAETGRLLVAGQTTLESFTAHLKNVVQVLK